MKKKSKAFFLLFSGLLIALAGLYYASPAWLARAGIDAERLAAGLHENAITVNGTRFAFLEGGDGPVIVLVHGFGGDKDNFLRFARRLTHDYRVVIPDLPGFGESTRDMKAAYDIVSQAGRLDVFIKSMGISSFHLGGHSMGGAIAGEYAAQHPDRVESLLLVAPAGVLSAPASELMKMFDRGENPFIVNNAADFRRLMDLNFVHQPFFPRPVRIYYQQKFVSSRDFLKKAVGDLTSHRYSLEERIGRYPGPVLVIWGKEDRILNPGGAEILKSHHPGLKVELIEQCGHLPIMEYPEKSAMVYRRFLSK